MVVFLDPVSAIQNVHYILTELSPYILVLLQKNVIQIFVELQLLSLYVYCSGCLLPLSDDVGLNFRSYFEGVREDGSK